MTTDERIDKLEHVTAAHIEQARKDYEENRRLWREQQTSIEALWKATDRRFEETRKLLEDSAKETRTMLRDYATESNEREKRMDARIEKLVSAIGELIANNGKVKEGAK